MYWHGPEGRVVAIQNLVGRSRIWLLSVDQQRGRISRALVLMRGHPDFF